MVLTDLAPSAGEAGGSGLRAGIEEGCKLTKRGGGQGQPPRMTDPQRAARWWVAVAVATVWLLSGGGLAEDTIPEGTRLPLADDDGPAARSRRATRLRLGRILRRGWLIILLALLNQRRLPQGRFKPEPWPSVAVHNTLRVPIELLLAA